MTTPYEQLRKALFDANARNLAVVDGPNVKQPHGSEIEFWNVPTPAPGRLVLVQRWKQHGGFDAYVPVAAHKTEEAIDEVLHGAPYEPQFMYTTGEDCEHAQFSSLAEMLEANVDDEDFSAWCKRALPGQSYRCGGGAAPLITTWRVS